MFAIGLALILISWAYDDEIKTFLTASDKRIKADAINAKIEGMKAGNQEWLAEHGAGVEHDQHQFFRLAGELNDLC